MKKKREINSVSARTSVVLHIIAIIGSLLCVLPFLLVIAISLTGEESIMKNGYQFIPSTFSLEGYKYIFKSGVSGVCEHHIGNSGRNGCRNAYRGAVCVSAVETGLSV